MGSGRRDTWEATAYAVNLLGPGGTCLEDRSLCGSLLASLTIVVELLPMGPRRPEEEQRQGPGWMGARLGVRTGAVLDPGFPESEAALQPHSFLGCQELGEGPGVEGTRQEVPVSHQGDSAQSHRPPGPSWMAERPQRCCIQTEPQLHSALESLTVELRGGRGRQVPSPHLGPCALPLALLKLPHTLGKKESQRQLVSQGPCPGGGEGTI